jgi:hypothetical protein
MIKSILLKYHNIFVLQDYLLSLAILLCLVFSGLVSQNALAEETSEDASISISIIGTPQIEVAEETSTVASIPISIMRTSQNAPAEETSVDTSIPISIMGTFQNEPAEENPDDTTCCQCHKYLCQEAMGKNNAHRPFIQQQCSICHVCDDADMEERVDTAIVEESIASSINKVTWLDYCSSHTLEHWFIIPFDLVNTDELIVFACDVRRKTHKETLLLPAIETIPLKTNDNKPPAIESAEVVGVYQGVLISACIDWLTDKESDSEIRYGIDTIQHSVKKDNFTIEHEIVLQNLQANQIYQYKVISRDIFGNMTESGIKSFTTEKLSPNPPSEYEQYQEKDFMLDTQFFQNNDSFILKFTANIPVRLSIGTKKINEEKVFPDVAKVNTPPNHKPMRGRDKISLSVCTKTCHADSRHTSGHPIDVLPPEDAIIPADYLLRSDGHITCVTCHATHASNNYRRLRFRAKGGGISAGKYNDVQTARSMGGCLLCHTRKGVLPNKRLPSNQGLSTRK